MKLILSLLIVLSCSAAIAEDVPATGQQQLQTLLQAAPPANPATPSPTGAPASSPTTPPPSTTTAPKAPVVAGTTVTPVDTGADVRDEAFATMTQSQLPMTPAQIRTLKKLFESTQRAVAQAPGIPAIPTSSSIAVNLAPGVAPPVIRLLSGYVTSLVFVDATGAPWPIKAYDLGDPSSFDIQWDQKGNTLLVQAITQYKQGNLAVQLDGLNTPVMLTLLPGQAAVDYRVDLHVPGFGPLALPVQSGLPGVESPLLLSVLSGIPPNGSKTLLVTPQGYADVWLLNNQLYIRTRATILSPAWIATLSSSDGTHAYKMPLTPLMIISQNGKPINLTIEGY